MRAVVQRGYGSPDDLEVRDIPVPVPSAGEVLVRVRAASLHPDVWHVVTARPWIVRLFGSGLVRPRIPIPGTDMAGVVESVGPDVDAFRPGDEVFGETILTNQWTNGGAFAELVTAPAELLATKPPNVTFEQAASVPTAGHIALMNLRHPSHLRAGVRALINGAGGGVGSLALQILKAYGAHVTAVDNAAKAALMWDLGADEVVDYAREDYTERDARYDLVFDIPGNRPFGEVRRVLAPGARYVLIGHERFGAAGRRVFGLLPTFLRLVVRSRFDSRLVRSELPVPTRPESMSILRELLAEGKLTPVIDSTWPLERIHDAFRRMVQEEPVGKVIITPAAAPGRGDTAR